MRMIMTMMMVMALMMMVIKVFFASSRSSSSSVIEAAETAEVNFPQNLPQHQHHHHHHHRHHRHRPHHNHHPHHGATAGWEAGWGVPLDGGEKDDQLQLGGGRRLAHKVECQIEMKMCWQYFLQTRQIKQTKTTGNEKSFVDCKLCHRSVPQTKKSDQSDLIHGHKPSNLITNQAIWSDLTFDHKLSNLIWFKIKVENTIHRSNQPI